MEGRVFSIAVICTLALVACAQQRPAPALRIAQTTGQAQINLGRQLFYDRNISGQGSIACASCHQPQQAFSDGRPTAANAAGAPLARNSPSLLNAAQRGQFGWASPRRSLEEQIDVALFAAEPPEMDVAGHEAAVLARLRAEPRYAPRFAAAFPNSRDPITWPHITAALAAFTRSLSASSTPYDRFSQGDSAALSLSAQRGMALFFSAGLACSHCHRDVAEPEAEAAYLANGAGRSADQGLAELSGAPSDAYHFRVPPMRNVAATAPYMHDGSLATLDAVIRFYESGGQVGAGPEPARAAARHPLIAGFVLSDSERADLISFLNALTDHGALSAAEFNEPSLPPPP